jgi:hypothetical protein
MARLVSIAAWVIFIAMMIGYITFKKKRDKNAFD